MFGLIALVLAAQADPQPDCKDPQTQADMNMCSARAFRAAEAAMTQQWDMVTRLMKKRDEDLDRAADKRPGYLQTLLESQRAWLKFRDAQCAAEGYYARGGTMEPMLVSSCAESLTEERTKQLRELAEQYEQ